MKLGFIGTGVMGEKMILHLLKKHEVFIFTRTKTKADKLLKQGALWRDSVAQIAQESDIVMTMVGFPSDVEEVYFGDQGLIENGKRNQIFIDFTTSAPNLAQKIYQKAQIKNISVLDAPVSGGEIGALKAQLSIMVGGNYSSFKEVLPILELLGTNIVYQGDSGLGQHTKMCNQIAIATNIIGVCEALIYAKKTNLDLEKVLQSIAPGAATSFSLSHYSQKILSDNLNPGFYIKHFVKDLEIALTEAKKMNLQLPGLKLAESLYKELLNEGKGDLGIQALITYWN